MMITIYLLRLIVHGLADADMVLSVFLVLGFLCQDEFSPPDQWTAAIRATFCAHRARFPPISAHSTSTMLGLFLRRLPFLQHGSCVGLGSVLLHHRYQ